jgi:hypothetical protein
MTMTSQYLQHTGIGGSTFLAVTATALACGLFVLSPAKQTACEWAMEWIVCLG